MRPRKIKNQNRQKTCLRLPCTVTLIQYAIGENVRDRQLNRNGRLIFKVLSYADDVLMGGSNRKLHEITRRFVETADNIGFQINAKRPNL